MSEARKILPSGHRIETDFHFLSTEEKSRVVAIEQDLQLVEPETALSFGSAAEQQGKMFFSVMAKHLKSRDLSHLGELLWDLSQHLTVAAQLESPPSPSLVKRVLKALFRGRKKQQKTRQMVETQISLCLERVRNFQLALIQDSNLLEEYFQEHHLALSELNVWVIAGERKLQSLRAALKKEQETYSEESSALSARGMSDFGVLLDSFSERVNILTGVRAALLRSLPLIRPLQEGNLELAQRVQSSVIDGFQASKRPALSPVGASEEETPRLQSSLSEGIEATLEFQHRTRQKRLEVCEAIQQAESELPTESTGLRILH